MPETLKDIIYEALNNCGNKKGSVAAKIGMPLSTLSRKVSPYDDGAKLAVAELIPFMRETASLSPLEFIASVMGYRLTSLIDEPDGLDMNHECLQGYEAVATLLTAASNGAHYTELATLLEKAIKELEDVFSRRRRENEKVVQ